jgi:large subunit ribosomal protein L9
MKIILLENIKKLGGKGETIEVKEGQARNFLIPKKLAIEATKKNINNLLEKKDFETKKNLANRDGANKIAEKLNKEVLSFFVKENNGKMFGSITAKSISESLLKLGYNIEKKYIYLKKPIVSLGKVNVKVKIYNDIHATIAIVIAAEEN